MTLRLRQPGGSPTIGARFVGNLVHSTIANPVRFSETINGRSYEIEVQPVGVDRWRAYLARAAGAPTALMPFYGGTPDEAAGQLARWLTRASRPSKPV